MGVRGYLGGVGVGELRINVLEIHVCIDGILKQQIKNMI